MWFCGSQLLAAKLRRSNIDASAGAVEEDERIVGQIRARWPKVEIVLRADSGFACEALMAWRTDRAVDYVFGLARNERLVGRIAAELAAVEAESLAQGGSVRRFVDFFWTTRERWSRERRVVAKVECTRGSCTRASAFIVTNLKRPAKRVVGFYHRRGPAKQWIKESKAALRCRRLSCRAFRANAVRLQLFALATTSPTSCVPWRPIHG